MQLNTFKKQDVTSLGQTVNYTDYFCARKMLTQKAIGIGVKLESWELAYTSVLVNNKTLC